MTCILVFKQLPLETLGHSVVLCLFVSMWGCHVILISIDYPASVTSSLITHSHSSFTVFETNSHLTYVVGLSCRFQLNCSKIVFCDVFEWILWLRSICLFDFYFLFAWMFWLCNLFSSSKAIQLSLPIGHNLLCLETNTQKVQLSVSNTAIHMSQSVHGQQMMRPAEFLEQWMWEMTRACV